MHRTITCEGTVGHSEGIVGYCGGTVRYCGNTVGYCEGAVGYCERTAGCCGSAVDHFWVLWVTVEALRNPVGLLWGYCAVLW